MEKPVNLNSIVFNEYITKEDILKHVNQEDVYSFYLNEEVKSLKLFCSPLREDKIPSFSLYFHRHNPGVLMFCDLATKESGDFIILVMKLFNLSYFEALLKIAYDFNLSNFDVETQKTISTYKKIQPKKTVNLGIKLRSWKIIDKNYWEQFNITKEVLKKYNVFPISHIFFNEAVVKALPLSYAYVEKKDEKITYKIYQPYGTKFTKWINNSNFSVHQGYTQLPKTGDVLIITKSLKDVMSLYSCGNYSAIGLQSETVMMKVSVMEEYKKRFNHVICLFDNDTAGLKLADEFSAMYNIPFFTLPNINNTKDFSDLVKEIGALEALEIFEELLYKNL